MVGLKVSGFHCSTSDPKVRSPESKFTEGCSILHFIPPLIVLICYQVIYFYKIFSSTNTLTEERCDRWALVIKQFLFWSQLVPNNSLFIQNRKYTQSSSSLRRSTHIPTEWSFFLSFFILCIFSQQIFILFLTCFLSYLLQELIWRVNIFYGTTHYGGRIRQVSSTRASLLKHQRMSL